MIATTFDIIFSEKINALLETIASWGGRNLNVHEELSCSYQSSRKKHEDVVYQHNKLYFSSPDMSKPLRGFQPFMECDSSNDLTSWRKDNYFIDHNDHNSINFDGTEKSFEHLRPNMNLPRGRR